MKIPIKTINKKEKEVVKNSYRRVAAIAVSKLEEDQVAMETSTDHEIANYRGVYLLISNRFDKPMLAVDAYAKRWKIEVFYRTAKQERWLESCFAISCMSKKRKKAIKRSQHTAKW